MDVESIQGQGLIAALSVKAKTPAPSPILAPTGNAVGDLLDLGGSIDSDYAQTVLKDSLADRLNAAFAQAGVEVDVNELLASSLDTSPEATAKRIVDFSTGFFEAFKSNNKGLKGEEQLGNFTSLIKGAVEKGFEDAGGILAGIGQVSEEVQGGIDKTFELVMKGIDDFAEQQRQALAEKQKEGEKGELVGAG